MARTDGLSNTGFVDFGADVLVGLSVRFDGLERVVVKTTVAADDLFLLARFDGLVVDVLLSMARFGGFSCGCRLSTNNVLVSNSSSVQRFKNVSSSGIGEKLRFATNVASTERVQ